MQCFKVKTIQEACSLLSIYKEEAKVISAEEALKYFASKPEEKGESVDKKFADFFNLAKEKLFAKHELPKIQGRRATAITTLKAIGESLPQAKDYCEDIITVIKELDDISDGILKDISQLSLRNIEEAYKTLLELVPRHYIQSIQERVGRFEGEEELILFAEQFDK